MSLCPSSDGMNGSLLCMCASVSGTGSDRLSGAWSRSGQTSTHRERYVFSATVDPGNNGTEEKNKKERIRGR